MLFTCWENKNKTKKQLIKTFACSISIKTRQEVSLQNCFILYFYFLLHTVDSENKPQRSLGLHSAAIVEAWRRWSQEAGKSVAREWITFLLWVCFVVVVVVFKERFSMDNEGRQTHWKYILVLTNQLSEKWNSLFLLHNKFIFFHLFIYIFIILLIAVLNTDAKSIVFTSENGNSLT